MNLSMRQMRAFLHVARTGNFTRAAERAHMTQAGLSILVREVERQIGARLFDRTTRAVQLTDAGRRFVVVAESVLQQLDDATAEVGELGRPARQQLRVAATPLVSSHLLPQLLADFRDAPRRRARPADRQQPAGRAGPRRVRRRRPRAGLLLPRHAGPGAPPRRRLPAHEGLAGGRAAGARSGARRWASLRSVPLITLPSDNPIQRAIDQQLDALGIERDEASSVSFLATLISMVEAGFGTAVMPTFAVAACRRHRVRLDLLGSPTVKLGFYRITRRGAAESDAMKAFSDALAKPAAADVAVKVRVTRRAAPGSTRRWSR